MAASGPTTSPLNVAKFLALPTDENVSRELIEGEVRERPMTTRSPKHAAAVSLFSHSLLSWLEGQGGIQGIVVSGEARCKLASDPDTVVGIDVALVEGEHWIRDAQGEPYLTGAPALAVEILSPSDTHEYISEKIRLYLSSGVKQVWVADPDFRTVTVHHSACSPVLYNAQQELQGDADLPDFDIPVAALFLSDRAQQSS